MTRRVPGTEVQESIQAWSTYWEQGHLGSCLGSASRGNYEGAIRDAWARWFDTLPDHARLLEIGTGNGAIALLAEENARAAGKAWQIDAIDRASTQPPADSGIRFAAGINAESLPFDDRVFDAVFGQYALEYTDCSASIPELARVARPGASLCFICHAAGSRVDDNAGQQLYQLDKLLDEWQLIALFKALVDAEKSAPAAEYRERKQAFDQAAASAMAMVREHRHYATIEETLQLLGQLYEARESLSSEQMQNRLDTAVHQLTASRERLRDLRGAVLDADALQHMVDRFTDAGAALQPPQPLHWENDALVGYIVSGTFGEQ